jgi:protocatechuate 3,4-dioxygenase beta subunit
MPIRRRIIAAAVTAVTATGLAAVAPQSAGAVTHPHPSTVAKLSAGERAAVNRAQPKPPRVTKLAPYRDGSTVTLGWHDPDAALFKRVLVRYVRGSHAPASPSEGMAVRLASPRASTATLAGLRPGRRYAAAVWTRDAMGRLSPRNATTFVAPPVGHGAAGTVSGTIVDPAGNPLSGVVVTAVETSQYTTVATTVTGGDGQYRISAPGGRTILGYDGADAQGGTSDATGYTSEGRSVTVLRRRGVSINVALRRGAALTGRVTDAFGNGLSNVAAYAVSASPYVQSDVGNDEMFDIVYGDFYGGAAKSAADGSFTIKGIYPDDIQVCLDPSSDAYYSSDDSSGPVQKCVDPPREFHAGQAVDIGTVALTNAPRGSVAGRVTAPDGTGVAGAPVEVARVGRTFGVGYTTTTSDGSYTVAGLKPGSYRVCADTSRTTDSASGLGYVSRCRARHITIAAGTNAEHKRVVVYPGGSFGGVVRAVDGTPVAGAEIVIQRPRQSEYVATTDAAGRWSVEGMRSGHPVVCVDATSVHVAGHPTGVHSSCYDHRSPFVVRRGKNRIGIDFSLQNGSAIRGTVLAGQGHPLPHVSIYAMRLGPSFKDGFATTGSRGHFAVVGLPSARYRLCFQSGLLADATLTRCPRPAVRTRAGKVSDVGTEDLGATGSITTAVTDAGGHRLDGVDVAALVPCHHRGCDHSPLVDQPFRVAASWTTYNGHVTLGLLRARSYAVCLFGYLAAPQHGSTPPTGYVDRCIGSGFDVQVSANRDTTLTSTLDVAGEITGTVTDPSGQPVRGMRVHVTGSAADDGPRSDFSYDPFDDPTFSGAVTAADGSYAVRSVAPGNQTVCVRATDGEPLGNFVRQCYGGDPGSTTGTPVSVTPAEVTSPVDLVLHRHGSIAGSVTTQSGTTLPRSTQVYIFRPNRPRQALVGPLGKNGRYHTPGLGSRNYVVCFSAKGYQSQCYNGVAWNGFNGKPLPSDATPVTVSLDATTSGIDATLIPR